MLPSVLNYRAKTNKELQEKVEERVLLIKEMHVEASRDTLHSEVDLLLKEKKGDWARRLLELMRDDKHQNTKKMDNALMILEHVCSLEKENIDNSSLLYRVSSLEELEEIYHKTVFSLCRMEFGMADEDCGIFLEYMKQWEFTVPYMIMVLEKSNIFRRINTGRRLGEFLLKNGYFDYGKQIIAWVNTQMEEMARRQRR